MKKMIKKMFKNIWLMFALSHGGIFFANEIKALEKKIDKDLHI